MSSKVLAGFWGHHSHVISCKRLKCHEDLKVVRDCNELSWIPFPFRSEKLNNWFKRRNNQSDRELFKRFTTDEFMWSYSGC